MWTLFTMNETDTSKIFKKIEKLKKVIYTLSEIEVKKYFARKLVVYFDNSMILEKENGLHYNLLNALSKSEKEMKDVNLIFKDVELFWFREEEENSFMIKNLNEEYIKFAEAIGFEFIHRTDSVVENIFDLRFESFQTLLFSTAIVNYAKNWIEYSPETEERSQLQASFMFLEKKTQKDNLDIYEQLELEKNLINNQTYLELLEKIKKIMPKIEHNLEKEWKYGIFEESKKDFSVEEAIETVNKKVEELRRKPSI